MANELADFVQERLPIVCRYCQKEPAIVRVEASYGRFVTIEVICHGEKEKIGTDRKHVVSAILTGETIIAFRFSHGWPHNPRQDYERGLFCGGGKNVLARKLRRLVGVRRGFERTLLGLRKAGLVVFNLAPGGRVADDTLISLPSLQFPYSDAELGVGLE